MEDQLIEIVLEFRETFNLKQDKLSDWELHNKLLEEEYQELKEAKNLEDKADALADIIFVSCGACIDGFYVDFNAYIDDAIYQARHSGIDLLRATKTVFTSNMSKLATLDSINSTRDKYAKLGVEVEFQAVDESDHTAGFRVICSRTIIGTDDKEYPVGKLLKSTNYKEPDWSYLSGVG